ncbi:MAG TPA: DeoR/GlpR family DNA-binding transcription regulator [Pseudonocardiaceae bacterium]
MTRYERLNRLLELLAEHGTLEVEAVAAELAVSVATVRRDLDHLAGQQLLTRTRGGAVANAVAYDLPLRYKSARNVSQKQRVAAVAAALVAPGAVVGLTGGTTTTELARALATDPALTGLTVVTNALNIAGELTVRPHVKLVVTGGVARPQSYELIGPIGVASLGGLALDVTFLGVDGLDPEFGACSHHEGEAEINRLLAARAARVVVVADGSKLGRRAFARICPVSAVHTLVTDDTAPAAVVDELTAAGVEVLRAS